MRRAKPYKVTETSKPYQDLGPSDVCFQKLSSEPFPYFYGKDVTS
jgi:hypothetical protein